MNDGTLLKIRDLTVAFETEEGAFNAVDRVSFDLNKGEIVGLVGESGCGKSVTALSLLRLIPIPPGRIVSGSALFKGEDLLRASVPRLREIRGRAISMIFQEPMAALSPLHRIGDQMVEALRFHENIPRKAAEEIALDWLRKVNIPGAEQRMTAYPFELSGGMQQRVMIAMALMMQPDLVIADEPTTALDVTVQAQIFELIREMRRRDTTILLITHDMGVVWEMCDRILVMYAGRLAEEGRPQAIFSNPLHPYTQGLLRSMPRLDIRRKRLPAIAGSVPSPGEYPAGCRFRDRCPEALDRCALELPEMAALTDDRRAACFRAREYLK